MQSETPLARPVRRFIVLVSLLQGLLMYLAETGHDHGWWPFSLLGGRVCWITLVLAVPGAMTLTVQRLDDRRFWQHAALMLLVLAVPASWAAWSATGAPGLDASEVLGPYGFTTALAVFAALPYLQCRLRHGRWCAPYAELFDHVWQNGLTLALAGLFTGICWGVLQLWAELFALVKIDFFRELFRNDAFEYLATGTMAGLGILIGRTQHRPIRIARQVVQAIVTGLLPLVAFIAVLFVLSLPFTGLAALWDTRSATFILMSVIGVMVLSVNAVWQDGEQPSPYPAWLRHAIGAGLLTLPVYGLIGLYALSLRIGQYGWTSERVFAVLTCVLLTTLAFAYAVAVLRRGGRWLAALPRINVAVSLVLIALMVAVNSPLLDPHRIAVADQLRRWAEARTDAAQLDLDYLRFRSGRYGYRALQTLSADARVAADPALAASVQDQLERQTRIYRHHDEEQQHPRLTTVDALAARLRPAQGSAPPDPALLQALLAEPDATNGCLRTDAVCLTIDRDFDGDGRTDTLLCNLDAESTIACSLWDAATGGRWQRVATLFWHAPMDTQRIALALRRGEVTTQPRRWPDLAVDSQMVTPAQVTKPSAPSEEGAADPP